MNCPKCNGFIIDDLDGWRCVNCGLRSYMRQDQAKGVSPSNHGSDETSSFKGRVLSAEHRRKIAEGRRRYLRQQKGISA